MRVILCATTDTILNDWKNSLKELGINGKVVDDEEELMQELSLHDSSQAIVCVEDRWLGKDFEVLKDFILAVQEWHRNLSVMVFSQHPNFSLGQSLLKLGVKGYGNARMMSVHFQDALNCVKKGDIWVYPEFVQIMIKTMNVSQLNHQRNTAFLEMLSPREKEIVELIYQGYNNKQIAQMTNITLRTVKAHTTSIYEKLHVKDRVALVLLLKS